MRSVKTHNLAEALMELASRLTNRRQWHTVESLAAMMEVSERTVWKWLKDGLPSYKFEGIRRVKLQDFEEWCLSYRVPEQDPLLEERVRKIVGKVR